MGRGSDAVTYILHQDLICFYSGYFKAGLRGGWFAEAEDTGFTLPDDDPDEFGRWVHWLYSCNACKQQITYSLTKPCSASLRNGSGGECSVRAERDWVFGDRMLCDAYMLLQLSLFIHHVTGVDAERLGWLLENVRETCSLYCFARHWTAWLKCRRYDVQPPAKFGAGDDLFDQVDGWSAKDPRRFALDHWFRDCGADIHAHCSHDSVQWRWPNKNYQLSGRITHGRRQETVWVQLFHLLWVSLRVPDACIPSTHKKTDKNVNSWTVCRCLHGAGPR